MGRMVLVVSVPCPRCDEEQPPAAQCVQCGLPLSVTGDWTLVELLGRGGMAPVYRVQRDGDPDAAAKLMRLGGGDSTWKARELFERSAAVLAKLDHPGLPKLYDFAADDDGTLVMVRELFEGHTLEQRIVDEHWHPNGEETTALLGDVLRLLVYLHDRPRPIVHRDIKPSNVMFRGEQPVLVDFDSVAGADGTSSTTIVVSPGYTAPEQLAGVTSPSADLYSVGATILFVVTGRSPHDFERDARGAPDIDDALRRCSPQLSATIAGLLEPDPTRRIASAADALARLDERATAIVSRTPEVSRPSAAQAKRPGVLVAALLLLGVGAFTAYLMFAVSQPEVPVPAQPPPQTAAPAAVPPAEVPVATPEQPPNEDPPTAPTSDPDACSSCPPAHGCLAGACVPKVKTLVPGRYVQCRILVDDTLQCTTRFNRHGESGAGTDAVGTWVSPRDLPAVRLAAAGTSQVCAVDQTEQLWCWGDNRYGFIPGQGKNVPIPTHVASPGHVVAIALGYDRPYLLTDDGKLWVQRDGGPWRRALRTKSIVEIDAERFLVVARDDKGAVWTWTHAPKAVSRVSELGPDTPVQLAVGTEHACARNEAGAVSCWGANDRGQVGTDDLRLQAIPVAVELPGRALDIDAAEKLSCALLSDAEVYCWGELDGATQTTPRPMGLGPATAMVTSPDGVCVLGEDRLARCVETQGRSRRRRR